MSEKNDRTSFELEVDNVRIAIEGTESYVDKIIKRMDNIVTSFLIALKTTPPSDREGAPKGGLPPPEGQDTITKEEEKWASIIAEKASISIEEVKSIFKKENEEIVIHKWDVSASVESDQKKSELHRVVSILYMFANDMVTNTRKYDLDLLKKAFDGLRLSFTDRDRDLRRNLKIGKLISEDKSGLLKLTTLGEKRAIELLKGTQQK